MKATQQHHARPPWVRRLSASAMAVLAAATLAGCGGGGGNDEPDRAWLGSWAAAPTGPAALEPVASFVPTITLENQTLRMIVRASVAGNQVRVRLSNEIGDAPAPVRVGAARIALRDRGSAAIAGSDRALTFSGQPGVTIPAEGAVFSDPVALDVGALADLLISVHLPERTVAQTFHAVTRQTNYVTAGNATALAAFPADSVQTPYWMLATGVDVMAARQRSGALIAFGDSITDGFGDPLNRIDSTPWPSWPSRLADRLQNTAGLTGLTVLNAGISGNRVLSDATVPAGTPSSPTVVRLMAVYGPKGLDRFQRDVIGQTGASCVVILEGINDIGIGGLFGVDVQAAQLIDGYGRLISAARAAGLKVIGATLLPFSGYTAGYYSAANEAKRQTINTWIRSSGQYDAVIDFDAVMRDPADPVRMQAALDSGDHLHPSDAGYKAMADSIDLTMVERLCIR